ncbi:Calmodulin-binding domain, plant, partial [Cynara cardunculus var. scolymus]
KPTPKFTRTGSLRSVKIFRSKSKNKSSFKPKKPSIDKTSDISEESHLERATFSSILKDSKFPEHLKHQAGPLEPEEVLPVAKFCPYQHCSLHGHHHHHEPPPKRFTYLKRRTANDQKSVKPESKSADKSSGKKREAKVTKKISNRESAPPDVDFSIEFYAKTRSEPLESYGHDDAEFADILFGVNSLQEKNKTTRVSNDRRSVDLKDENDGNSDGLKSELAKKPVLKKANHMSMWHMIHRHMVSGLAAESGDEIPQQLDDEKKSHETEIRKMFAIKLVREAIEKILLPEVQDDQSTTSEVISEQNLSEISRNGNEDEITSHPKDEPEANNDRAEEQPVMEEPVEKITEKRTPKRWSNLKKVILLSKFVKELEKVKKFNPKKPINLPLAPEPESEKVSLRRQKTDDKKNADEWMLDYALQKVVSELAPTQKKKVALLVKAFETVAPAHEDQQDSRSNAELQRVGSETKVKFQGIHESGVGSKADFEIKTTPDVGSSSFSERSEEKKESRFDFGAGNQLEKEKHIKMWHMIYQHVATDIATKIGSELLLDGEESTNSEEKNLQEVEGHTGRKHGFRFTDAVKLVRESVDEILLPDIPDNSSQETQSVACDVSSDHEEHTENVEKGLVFDENKKPEIVGSFGNRLQQQKSKNWSKLKKLILLKRSIKALEGFRKLKPQTPERKILINETEEERVELRRQMMDERKKAEQWMLDYAVQHIVTKLTPARKKRVSMLVEAFEAVVPLPDI